MRRSAKFDAWMKSIGWQKVVVVFLGEADGASRLLWEYTRTHEDDILDGCV